MSFFCPRSPCQPIWVNLFLCFLCIVFSLFITHERLLISVNLCCLSEPIVLSGQCLASQASHQALGGREGIWCRMSEVKQPYLPLAATSEVLLQIGLFSDGNNNDVFYGNAETTWYKTTSVPLRLSYLSCSVSLFFLRISCQCH